MYPSVQSSPDFASYGPAVAPGLLDEDFAALFASTGQDVQFTGFTQDPTELDLFSNYFQGQNDHIISSTVSPSFGFFPSLAPAPGPSSTSPLLGSTLWPYSPALFPELLSYSLPPEPMSVSSTSVPPLIAPPPSLSWSPSYSTQSLNEQFWTQQGTYSSGFPYSTMSIQASELVEPDHILTYREEEASAMGSSNAYMHSAGFYESSPTPPLAYSPKSSPSTSSLAPPTPPSCVDPSLDTRHQDRLLGNSYGPATSTPSGLFIDDTGGNVNALQSLPPVNTYQLAYEPNQVDLRCKEVTHHVIKSVLPAAGQQLHHHSKVQYTAGHTATRERGPPLPERAESAEEPSTNGSKDKARAGKTGSARWQPYPVAGRGEGRGKGSEEMNTQMYVFRVVAQQASSTCAIDGDLTARGRRAAGVPSASVLGLAPSGASKRGDLDKKRACKPANTYFKLKTGENRERVDRRPAERIGELRAETILGIPKKVTFVGGPKRNKKPKKASVPASIRRWENNSPTTMFVGM